MPPPSPPPAGRHDWPLRIRDWARALGFADAGVATLALDEDRAHLRRWLEAGRHGGMAWMAEHEALRGDPAALQPGTVRTALSQPFVGEAGSEPAQAAQGLLQALDAAPATGRALFLDHRGEPIPW